MLTNKDLLAIENLLKKHIGGLEDEVTGLKGDVFTLKSDVSTLKSDVSTLKSDVSTLKNDVSELKAGVSSLNGRVSDLEQDMVALKDDMKTVKVAHLENNVIPRLNTIEKCYVDTSNRYNNSADKFETAIVDIEVMKLAIQKNSSDIQELMKKQA